MAANDPADTPPPAGAEIQAFGLSSVCDFCERKADEHPPRWHYPLGVAVVNYRGFEMEVGGPLFPLGDFVTCDQCHDLVEREDFRGLAELAGYGNSDELPDTIRQFQARRQGQPRPYRQQ